MWCGKYPHDGSILHNQAEALAANETPDASNPSVKAYVNFHGKKVHDAAIETCKGRKIELAGIARKCAAKGASAQAPAAKIKRSFLVLKMWLVTVQW